MATSAATLSTIIATLSTKYNLDKDDVTLLLSGKGLLPKKLLTPAKAPKVVTKWASKAAEELAEEHGCSPDGIVGSGKGGKITVKDVKGKLETPKAGPKVSPSALKYARDNKLDITRIAHGSGSDGRILLKDVQELSDSETEADSEDEGPALSPSAAKLVKQYDLDEDDLVGIKGTGAGGKILKGDLKALIDELESE